MKNTGLEQLGFKRLTEGPEKDISGGFCGDLLSWAMARVEAGHVWFTVMGNLNTIAVASLADAAGVVLCHGADVPDEVLERATQEGISVFATELPEYEAACLLHDSITGER